MVASSGRGRRVKPSGGFELGAWYFMRISGLTLVLLALGHLFIVHILFNVETINYAFVADRWTKPGSGFFWRLWDLAMVVLAVIHGLNGLRQILDEYIVRPGRRVIVHTLIWTVATVLVGMGSYAILMFEKDQEYIKAHPRKGQSQTVTASVAPRGR
ncbi:succinate dehydrogenase / fumarate reductase membrane anchor subunit [Singulisphaera sp. GP187]|nr:succinate dehydrogenase / fumarate reductase membrane anchor subunit [Singulisphaera sp. GP187]